MPISNPLSGQKSADQILERVACKTSARFTTLAHVCLGLRPAAKSASAPYRTSGSSVEPLNGLNQGYRRFANGPIAAIGSLIINDCDHRQR